MAVTAGIADAYGVAGVTEGEVAGGGASAGEES